MTSILQAREDRWLFRQQLVQREQLPLLSLGLNIPGGVKNTPLYSEVFGVLCQITRQAFTQTFGAQGWNKHEQLINTADGTFWHVLLSCGALPAKELCVSVEDAHSFTRLADIDILCPQRGQLSRQDSGQEPRLCFLCSNPATLCRLQASHPPEAVLAKVQALCHKALAYAK